MYNTRVDVRSLSLGILPPPSGFNRELQCPIACTLIQTNFFHRGGGLEQLFLLQHAYALILLLLQLKALCTLDVFFQLLLQAYGVFFPTCKRPCMLAYAVHAHT